MSLKHSIAWLQLKREKLRLAVALAGVAFSNILMFMQLGFEGGMYDSNTRLHKSLDGDLVMIASRSKSLAYTYPYSNRRLYQVLGFPAVESISEVYVEYGSWKNVKKKDFWPVLVFGIDPDKPAFNSPEIKQNLSKLKQPNHILFDRKAKPAYGSIIEDFQLKKTATTEINNYQVEVVGLFPLGPSFAADGNIITSDTNFHEMFKLFRHHRLGFISIGLIRLKPGYDAQQVLEQLKQHLPSDVTVLTHAAFIEFEKNYWRTSTPIGFLFRLGTLVGFIIGIVIVYQIIHTDVSDHLPQYATLKAMGYTNQYLLRIVFHEALILAILGYIPGFTISIGLYQFVKVATLLPIQMTAIRAAIVLLLTILMCCLSGIIAVRKLRKADPADIF